MGIVAGIGLLLALISGITGECNHEPIVIHDTTIVIDTITRTDTVYQPAQTDTIVIQDTSYEAKQSIYKFSRGGYAKVWYIPRRELFKWDVREPKPIVITKTHYQEIRIPTIDYRATIGAGIIGIITGAILITIYNR